MKDNKSMMTKYHNKNRRVCSMIFNNFVFTLSSNRNDPKNVGTYDTPH